MVNQEIVEKTRGDLVDVGLKTTGITFLNFAGRLQDHLSSLLFFNAAIGTLHLGLSKIDERSHVDYTPGMTEAKSLLTVLNPLIITLTLTAPISVPEKTAVLIGLAAANVQLLYGINAYAALHSGSPKE